MNYISTIKKGKKAFFTIIFGILGFVLSPYGIAVEWGEVVIDLPWSLLFPIIIAMAYGWQYGFLSGLAGGALFPFLLWANNGWTNVSTTLCFLIIYALLGLPRDKRFFPKITFLPIRHIVVFIVCVLLLIVYFNVGFSRILTLNPAFWNSNTITSLDSDILAGFAIKDGINIIILSIVAEALLNLPIVCRLLGIQTCPEFQGNSRIFIYSLATSFLIWLSFVGLGHALLRDELVLRSEHISLAFLVIMASGFFVSRMLFDYNRNQIIIRNELNYREEKFRMMIKNSNDTFVLINKSGEQFFISDAAVRDTGFSIDELKGPIQSVIYPDDWPIISNAWTNVVEKSEIVRVQYRHKHKYKGYIWYEAVAQNFLDNPAINAVVVNVRDITKIKETEIELIKAKEKAEESDRLKTAFLQNMSHEIRTPMNAIMGFSSLLVNNFNNREKLENFSKIIELRCNDLLDIINDVLDISKIESGQSTLNIENCNIKELFDELALFFNDYKERINKQHIQVQFYPLHQGAILCFNTDKLKLKQVLINLVSNALKFTETGSVTCGYKRENNQLQFYVTDTGIGIPADKHDYIFERFSQLKHPSIQNVGGTGLGLPIVKGLVKLMGGNIWLESESNKGSTFYFTIDYIKADLVNETNPALTNKQEIVTDKTILVVEDDFYNAEYLKEVLRQISSNVVLASTGLDAVKIAREQEIDLILMDIRLPDITGYEAIRLILQNKPDIKIIAQTAYAGNVEQEKAIDAGCIDYISKPTTLEQLLTLVSKYLK